ncbi:MAG: guanylate kinase [Nitrospirales bacterium]|nr:guanylate kinase [Nitrospirales bacterium]
MRQKGLLIVVSGPSGVGKSTLCRAITTQLARTTLSVSCTTRRPRPGERDGVEYHFIEKSQFEAMVQRQEFVEWATVYGNMYGTPSQQLEQAMEQGIDVLLDIDTQGARQIMKCFSDAVSVFIMPPSLDALQDRLLQRAADAPAEVQRRFQKAREEILNYHVYGYVLRNDDLTQATRVLEAVILAERMKTTRMTNAWLIEYGLMANPDSQHIPII